MKCLILIGCIVASLEQSAMCSDDAMDTGDATADGAHAQPAICGICGVCEAGLYDCSADATSHLKNIECPECGANFVHLECALKGPFQIRCSGCKKTVCCKTAELDAFFGQLRDGRIRPEDVGADCCALDALVAIGSSLMSTTLHSYDMTADELKLLKNIADKAGATYHEVVEIVEQLIKLKAVLYMRAGEIVASLKDAQALSAVLLIVGIAITPNFIADAKQRQIMALIGLLASYRGFGASISNALARKVIDLADIVRNVPFSNDNIKNLLVELINSDSCAVVKHLVGRHRFGHQLTDDDICAIVERYAVRCTYSDETFVPLLMLLVGGYAGIMACKPRLQRLADRLLQQNSKAATLCAYKKLQCIVKKCESSAMGILNAINDYPCVSDDGDFSLSEDLFCAAVGTWDARSTFIYLLGRAQDARSAYIARHIPFCWARKNTKICINIVEQAIAQGNFVVLEEMLVALINMRQSPESMRRLFEGLLGSGCRDHAGLFLRIINNNKLSYLKENSITDWLLEQLVSRRMYWCIPYLERSINDTTRYRQVVGQYHQEIINTTVTGVFRFSPLCHEIVRYDAKNIFFIENLRAYLEALLKASTNKYVVQRLLIEVCSTYAFKCKADEDKLAGIYGLFKMHPDRLFYLDALFYALQHTTQKNCLKALIMDGLEESAGAEGRWVGTVVDALQERRGYRRCHGYKCVGSNCKSCKTVSGVEFRDLLAVLRHAQTN